MTRWLTWRSFLHRARAWDAPHPADPEVRHLKALFASARTEDPGADERLWWRLRHRLAAPAARAETPSLAGLLAAAGPRFALGAALTLALTAGVFLAHRDPLPTAGSLPATAEIVASLENPESVVGAAFQARDGGELLQFIAYAPQEP